MLARYIRTHPKPFAIAVLGSMVFASGAVGGTIILGQLTDKVFRPALEQGRVDAGTVWGMVAAIIIVAALRSCGVVARRFCGQVTSRRMQVTLRTQIMHHYLRAPLKFYRDHPTGELLSHADTDVEVAVDVINPLPFSLGLILLIVFSVIALVVTDPLLAVVGMFVFPAMLMLNRFYTRRVEAPAEAVQQCVGNVATIAHESYDGALVVKTLGLESHEIARLQHATDELREARMRVGVLRSYFEPALDVLPNIGVIAILAIGGWRISTNTITTGDLVQISLLFSLLSFPMRVVGFLLEEMPRSVVALARVDRVLAEPIPPLPSTPIALPSGPLGVSFHDVTFAFATNEPVLRSCSFTVAPGEIVALVGATGCGKTTLCELMTGLIEPAGGTISIGGVDLTTVDRESLTGATALVFQESFLFADTIAENLSLGEADVASLHDAVRLAQAERFINNLSDGYDTTIGERGVTLSGGQRQRAALARALVRRPRLLVLDDATSAVDPTVEARILDGLKRELETTAVIVAHRVSTIALADRVLFMHDGVIAASGSHADLITSEPEYAAMVSAYETAGARPIEDDSDD